MRGRARPTTPPVHCWPAEKEHFAELAVDAVLRLKGSTNLDAIQILKKPGGTIKVPGLCIHALLGGLALAWTPLQLLLLVSCSHSRWHGLGLGTAIFKGPCVGQALCCRLGCPWCSVSRQRHPAAG